MNKLFAASQIDIPTANFIYLRWVYSTELPQSDYGNHSIYDAASSNSSKPINATWSISYGDGSSANGGVHTDIVSVGGATVQMQAIELASNVSSEFLLDFSNDGLLGLGFDSINNGPFLTLLRPYHASY